ncbi:MAG TPA: DNA polymerase/3'-5' exonuclease PolX [Pyrinomonadaceae bacterium]|nr:DNA polymerase/3'-5' exonuclease PolX [Pyrinomonadaceae bacterium]
MRTTKRLAKPLKDKFAIAAALQEIGALLELKGGQYFKARAYKAGARAVAELSEDVGKLLKQNRLTFVKGIGHALAKQIDQLYSTGESSMLNELRGQLPAGIIELSHIPGLSVQKVGRLQEELGISSVEELRAACEAGKVRDVKGFGAKTEQKILDAIAGHEKREQFIHIHHAWRLSERILEYLATARGVLNAEAAGATRRWKETVSEIVIVASAKNPQTVVEHFLRFPLVIRTESKTRKYCSVVLSEGYKATLFAVKPEEFAITLWRATGSEAHLNKLQPIAAKKKLNVVSGNGNFARGSSPRMKSESDIYKRLGLQYVPPELREDAGEIEAALKGKLPEDLIATEDIRGMVHCHTMYSDGKHSVEQMVATAETLGMNYITITDHSPTAFYAGGVKIDRLQQQWEEIERVQEQTKVKILKGTESDILQDGSLDYPDWILEQFDVIVASIHSRYKMNSEQMTKRVVTAMRQRVFKIWGHALGRLIQRRPPFECDVERILDVIAESRAAVEINGDPHRLDMEPRWIREARKRKIKFVISVDAHSMNALHNVKYGVGIARRGWVRKGEVLNALGVKAFQKAVRPL